MINGDRQRDNGGVTLGLILTNTRRSCAQFLSQGMIGPLGLVYSLTSIIILKFDMVRMDILEV